MDGVSHKNRKYHQVFESAPNRRDRTAKVRISLQLHRVPQIFTVLARGKTWLTAREIFFLPETLDRCYNWFFSILFLRAEAGTVKRCAHLYRELIVSPRHSARLGWGRQAYVSLRVAPGRSARSVKL